MPQPADDAREAARVNPSWNDDDEAENTHHLARLELIRARGALNPQLTSAATDFLTAPTQLARRSPGFIWSLSFSDGLAAGRRLFDDHTVVLLSLWGSFQELWYFADASRTLAAARARREWSERGQEANVALWWEPAGRRPSPIEAARRLSLLRRLGPTPEAFTFKNPYPAPLNN